MFDLSKLDLSSILNDEFLKNNTPFNSFADFIGKMNIDLSNGIGDELEAVNHFIKDNTSFTDLNAMLQKATASQAGGLLDSIKSLF